MKDNLIGKEFGRYLIVEALGEGGMAAVYKGYDRRLNRDVAIKLILRGFDQKEIFLKRFEREAIAVAQLTHPNIVRVIDYGTEVETPYLVMEFIPGGTLKEQMGKPISWHQAARMLAPVARALDYAHNENIIHRDIKPANLLITKSGDLMVSDFGVAKTLGADNMTNLTGTGVGIGTPAYMAPEQGMGTHVDHRVDIYSLGVVFYEMITGRPPYQADTPMAVMLKHMNDPLPRPQFFVAEIPVQVEQVVFKALAKDPSHRFGTMKAFVHTLEELSHGVEVEEPVDETQVAGIPEIAKTVQVLVSPTSQKDIAPDNKVNPPEVEIQSKSIGKLMKYLWVPMLLGLICIGIIAIFAWSPFFRSFLAELTTIPTEGVSMQTATLTGLNETQLALPLDENDTTIPTLTEQAALLAILTETQASVQLTEAQEAATSLPTDTPLPTNTPRPTFTPKPASPMFTTTETMFCREGPDTFYEAHFTLGSGKTVPVLAKWVSNNWLLVGINDSSTRTKCCWIGGEGNLNVNISTLKTINFLPDRIQCDLTP